MRRCAGRAVAHRHGVARLLAYRTVTEDMSNEAGKGFRASSPGLAIGDPRTAPELTNHPHIWTTKPWAFGPGSGSRMPKPCPYRGLLTGFGRAF